MSAAHFSEVDSNTLAGLSIPASDDMHDFMFDIVDLLSKRSTKL
jgi:hypothetical protein